LPAEIKPPRADGKYDRTKRKKPLPSVHNPDEKAARAHEFMLARVAGKSFEEIARRFDCSTKTAYTYVEYARQHGLYIDRARHLIETHLLPKALAVYEQYMTGERTAGMNEKGLDFHAAQDILFGLGALSKTTNVKHTPSDVNDTLDGFRAEYFKDKELHAVDVQPTPAALPPTHTHERIDVAPRRESDLRDQADEDG
jgi:hypothetical protein